MTKTPDWIAVDWGTSHVRAWAMTNAGEAMDHATSTDGMAHLAPQEFEPALLRLIAQWLSTDRTLTVVACGMVGARQGWIEAPYRATPCSALARDGIVRAVTADRRISVHIVPGICQMSPPDVMRGEETQLAGFLGETTFEGTICLPGTHTKWVDIDQGVITGFRTMMTGEIFALLSDHSVLRHSIGTGWDTEAFLSAVKSARAEPEKLAGSLFALRASALLKEPEPDRARSILSGSLIGVELAAVAPLAGRIAILGADGIATAYRSALEASGHDVSMIDTEQATLRGLTLAYAEISETV